MLDTEIKKSILASLQENEVHFEKGIYETTKNQNGNKVFIKLTYTVSYVEYPCIDPQGKKRKDHNPYKSFGMKNFQCKNCGLDLPKPLTVC